MLIFFVILWAANFVSVKIHIQHYQNTINDMAKKGSGFLGVGMTQAKFKPKRIMIMTTNDLGVIDECKILSGLTVFAKFKSTEEFSGYHVDNLPDEFKRGKYGEPLIGAVKLLKQEMTKLNGGLQ